MNTILFLELLLAHLLADFWLQPQCLVGAKKEQHIWKWPVWLHGAIAAIASGVVVWRWDMDVLIVVGVVFFTHTIIDMVKVCLEENLGKEWNSKGAFVLFATDQILHIGVMVALCIFLKEIPTMWCQDIVLKVCAYLLCGTPVNVGMKFGLSMLGVEVRQGSNSNTIAHAGACIGTLERWLILTFAILSQYEVIGLILAAKSLLRFGDKEELRSEYVLVGTFLSLTIALLCAYCVINFK